MNNSKIKSSESFFSEYKNIRKYFERDRPVLVFLSVLISGSALLLSARLPIAYGIWNFSHEDDWVAVFANDNASLEREMGDYYFSSAHYDIARAKTHFEHAVALDEHVPLAHYQLARIYFIEGRSEKALVEINKQIDYYPEYHRDYYIKGLILGYAKDFDGAIENFKRFISLEPRIWAGYNDLAWVYFAKGDFTDAAQAARGGLAVDSSNTWLLNSLGVSLMNTGDKVGAKKALEKAARLVRLETPERWGRAYPGNDPASYEEGLSSMRTSIGENLAIIEGNPHPLSD